MLKEELGIYLYWSPTYGHVTLHTMNTYLCAACSTGRGTLDSRRPCEECPGNPQICTAD